VFERYIWLSVVLLANVEPLTCYVHNLRRVETEAVEFNDFSLLESKELKYILG
jgi:hypothetical protein